MSPVIRVSPVGIDIDVSWDNVIRQTSLRRFRAHKGQRFVLLETVLVDLLIQRCALTSVSKACILFHKWSIIRPQQRCVYFLALQVRPSRYFVARPSEGLYLKHSVPEMRLNVLKSLEPSRKRVIEASLLWLYPSVLRDLFLMHMKPQDHSSR